MRMTRQERYEKRQLRKAEAKREEERKKELQKKEDEKFMRQAITQAKKALALCEVPIGCVIVRDGRVIARGYNRRNTDKSPLAHAEISAVKKASARLGDWRLSGCTAYVTLEPCQMCSGAMMQARVERIVYAAKNPKAGCAGSVMNMFAMKEFNHQAQVEGGVCEEECMKLLQDFFSLLRKSRA